ncbi:hypothetical protein APHAL10511_000290, partial [Amanita phalloides]
MKFFFALLALPVLATASVLPRDDHDSEGSTCSTGEQVCCNNQFKSYNDLNAAKKLDLGLLLGGIGLGAALVCDPVDIIAIGGNSCNAQVACCSHVYQ